MSRKPDILPHTAIISAAMEVWFRVRFVTASFSKSFIRGPMFWSLVTCVCAGAGFSTAASAQTVDQEPADSATLGTPAEELAAASGPPIGIVLGLGWGMRQDDCIGCAEAENTSSFAFHLSLTKALIAGVGVGLDVSAWQRGHPAPAGATRPSTDGGDSGDSEAEKLTNRLANVSVVFSYQASVVYLRGGVGIAMGWADVVESDGTTDLIQTASGKGVGYTAGAGIILPVSGNIGLSFYGNWNYGKYDISSPTQVVARGATHEFLELGIGIAFR